MKVAVDPALCEAHGQCMSILPEVFDLDDDEVLQIREGELAVGWVMNVSLSFDHRVLDGADAIRFTQTLARYVADPGRLLKELV